MVTTNQAKILVGSFVAGAAVLTIMAGAAIAQNSGQSGGCGCCNMGQMNQPSGSTGR
jgi:hypothetical protein